jgi:hypothetical protein
MGTSTNYNPPTSFDWKKLKNEFTRFVNSGSRLDSGSASKLVKDYILANGGSHQMASGGGIAGGSKAAQNISRGIAGLFSSVGRVGFQEAIKQFGLETFEGKSISEITFSILDYLGGPASSINDVDARSALSDLINEILEDASNFDEVKIIMESLSNGKALEGLLIRFFGLYLYHQFCRVFYAKVAELVGETKAESFQNDVKDFILSMLENVTFGQNVTQVDWSGVQGRAIADKILQKTLEVFTM